MIWDSMELLVLTRTRQYSEHDSDKADRELAQHLLKLCEEAHEFTLLLRTRRDIYNCEEPDQGALTDDDNFTRVAEERYTDHLPCIYVFYTV
jgi:hypothetical protein